MNYVYLNGGCGKTRMKINDAMPHTCIAWSIDGHNLCHQYPIHIQEMSAVRMSFILKTSTFPFKTVRKHFQYVCRGHYTHDTTKL